MPTPVFYVRTPNISSIKRPPGFVFVLCISSDGVILRPSCVLYYLTVEKAENSSMATRGVMTTWEQPKRADKNGASTVSLLISPCVSPCVPPSVPLTPRHATLRHTKRHRRIADTTPRTSQRHATPPAPRRPATTAQRRNIPRRPNAIRHARRDEHEESDDKTRQDGTRTQADKNGATRQRGHETPDDTERRDKTGREAEREAKRQRRHENANPRDTNGTPTRDDKTRRETGRQYERNAATRRGTGRDETPSPRPSDTRNEKKRHAMPSPPCPRHTAIIA